MISKRWIFLFGTHLISALILAACSASVEPESNNNNAGSNLFIRSDGSRLVVGAGESIRLRGINFNNYHWEIGPELILDSDHHSELDYQRVADMGMNVIRFNLSYILFEDDDHPYDYMQSGWDWLDQNIDWARKYGLYLIIDMHVPQGGYQGGTDDGYALWEEAQNQDRLKALWVEIATRYHDEPVVAGWDIVNEPTPSKSQQ